MTQQERLEALKDAYAIDNDRLSAIKARIQEMMDNGATDAQIDRAVMDTGLDVKIKRLRSIELEIESLEISLKIR